MSKDVLLNEAIHFKEVRCVGDGGEQFGIISSSEALKIAHSRARFSADLSERKTPRV
ncbi:hypothetical protein ASB7_10290 [Helicobacter ailurogastricus]|nr:hypothetical protein ASB7_10290 [Helicobacter ailurogastricus]